MEKRFFLGVGILAVFLVLGLLTTVWVESANRTITQDLEQAVRWVEDGQIARGTARGQRAKDTWQKHWRGIAAAADHNPMDEIDGLFAQMEFYANIGAAKEFGACCARLGQLVEAVTDAHRLTWWNFL